MRHNLYLTYLNDAFALSNKVPVSGLSFVDSSSGEDKTEAARAIMREKAPELLQLMAQVPLSRLSVNFT